MNSPAAPNWIAAALAVLVLCPALTSAQARLKQVAENQTWVSPSGASSQYIEARGFNTAGRPLVVGGNFEQAVSFPVPGGFSWSGTVSATPRVDSIFLGILKETTPGEGWHAGATSANFDHLEPRAWFNFPGALPSSEMRDLAVTSESRAYLCGVVDQTTILVKADDTSLALAPPFQIANGRGFLATANNGKFTAASLTDLDLRPRALAAENAEERLVVFGQRRDGGEANFERMDAILQRYAVPTSSTPVDEIPWNIEPKFQNMDAKDVAVTSSDEIWVGGSVSGISIEGTPPTGVPLGGTTDLWIGRADFPNTRIVDDFKFGSEGFDQWGGMATGPHGEIYVAFKVGGRTVTFGNLSITVPSFPISHSCLGMIKSDGSPAWVTSLARGNELQSSMIATDLDVDRAGNAYVSVNANGNFTVRATRYSMSGSGQIMVDGTGRVVSFTPTPNVLVARASVVFDSENRFVLGRTSPPFVEGKASFSSIQSAGIVQAPYTITWVNTANSDNTVFGLDRLLTETGGQAYLSSDFHFPPALPIKTVSGYLTAAQVATLGGNPRVILKTDSLSVTPDQGEDPVRFESVDNAGWALARLLDPFDLAGESSQFHFPSGFVTTTSAAKKVRVYVIDKGLAPAQQFSFPDLAQNGALPISFDGENGLCVDALAHQTDNGELDPDTASDHPKQAVNLIAVEARGSAQGTAMEFISVDMYTGSSTEPGNCLTFLSFVSRGILQAVADANERDLIDPLPSVIVIASSGLAPKSQLTIGPAIGLALTKKIPVILSAGNDGANVADYVPARLGELDGVITVGGIAEGSAGNPNPLYSDSNLDPSGSIISLYTPGQAVPTGIGTSSGTSSSCALVAGIAATYLSMHPSATPAEVEEALVAFSFKDPRNRNIAQSTCSFAAWLVQNGLGGLVNDLSTAMIVDSDDDGLANLGEFLGGSDPNNPLDRKEIPGRVSPGPGGVVISALLPRNLVGPAGRVGDGCGTVPFGIEFSTNLRSWQPLDPSTGVLRSGGLSGPLQESRFEIDPALLHPERCFFRYVFGPPAAP